MDVLTDPLKIDNNKWTLFVNNHPFGNFFQSPVAFYFFRQLENFKPFVIIIHENYEIKGVLTGVNMFESGILFPFSGRTIIWGGPLLSEVRTDHLNLLFKELKTFTGKTIYTEIRNLFNPEIFSTELLNAGFRFKPHLNYIIPLISEQENMKLLSKSKQRQIKISLKNSARIQEAESLKDARDFYLILKKLYRTKVRKPLPAFDFFKTFYEKVIGKLFIIKYKSDVIGGIVCPIFNNKYIYEWYIAAKDGYIKNIYPSVLSTWAAIKYGLENGFEYFDFLGAGSPDSDYGVREFKSKFGGNLVNNGRFIRINRPLLYHAVQTGLKISKKLG